MLQPTGIAPLLVRVAELGLPAPPTSPRSVSYSVFALSLLSVPVLGRDGWLLQSLTG